MYLFTHVKIVILTNMILYFTHANNAYAMSAFASFPYVKLFYYAIFTKRQSLV